jgi:hypothetical protein
MQNPSKITCPKCGTEIDVQNVLTHQIEDDLKKTYELKNGDKTGNFIPSVIFDFRCAILPQIRHFN